MGLAAGRRVNTSLRHSPEDGGVGGLGSRREDDVFRFFVLECFFVLYFTQVTGGRETWMI